MRRGLGFKLRETERGLIDFAAFLEANDTPHITTELALAWAQRPSRAQPAYWARRLGYVRAFEELAPPVGPGCSCVPSYEVNHMLDFDARILFGALEVALRSARH